MTLKTTGMKVLAGDGLPRLPVETLAELTARALATEDAGAIAVCSDASPNAYATVVWTGSAWLDTTTNTTAAT